MGHNIFLLDISHLTEMDMVSFIKGEPLLFFSGIFMAK